MEGNIPEGAAQALAETSGPAPGELATQPATPAEGLGPETSSAQAEAKARAAARQEKHRKKQQIRSLADKVESPEEFQAAVLKLAKQAGVTLPSAEPAAEPAQEQTFPGIQETFEIGKGRPGWPSDQRIMAAGELAAQLTAIVEVVSKALGPRFDLSRPRTYKLGDKVYTTGGQDELFQAIAAWLGQYDVIQLLATPIGNLVMLLGVSFGLPAAEIGAEKLLQWAAGRGAQ